MAALSCVACFPGVQVVASKPEEPTFPRVTQERQCPCQEADQHKRVMSTPSGVSILLLAPSRPSPTMSHGGEGKSQALWGDCPWGAYECSMVRQDAFCFPHLHPPPNTHTDTPQSHAHACTDIALMCCKVVQGLVILGVSSPRTHTTVHTHTTARTPPKAPTW